jgi:hypothetical protein
MDSDANHILRNNLPIPPVINVPAIHLAIREKMEGSGGHGGNGSLF